MDKKSIQVLEGIKGLIEEMSFSNLKGKDLFPKVFLIQEFLKVIKEAKEPPIQPVGKPTPIKQTRKRKPKKVVKDAVK